MGSSAELQATDEHFNPVTVLQALDACSQSLVLLENGRVLYANCAFEKEMGFAPRTSLRGRLLTDLIPQSPPRLVLPTVSSFKQKQIETFRRPRLQVRKSIFEVICAPTIRQLNSRDTSPSELKATEAMRLVSSEIAHNFGNLLTTILLYSDLLISGVEPNSRLRRRAEAIRTAGEGGVALVRELTSPLFDDVAASPLSWNQAVSDTTSFLTRWVGETIEIKTRLTEMLGFVKIDINRARQIILNLVSNARDAMPIGGSITISTRNVTNRDHRSSKKGEPAGWVDLVVTDTGVGMDKKVLAQVFKPFFTTKPHNQGTGVGLTMVRDVVNKAGGKVMIQSTLEKGTRVTVRMPRIPGLTI
jgi:two-component system cell cycle sensor histidine kinase/response regulator CckA